MAAAAAGAPRRSAAPYTGTIQARGARNMPTRATFSSSISMLTA